MRCRYHERHLCASCTLLPRSYEEASQEKFDRASHLVRRGFPATEIREPCSAKNGAGSRTKLKMVVAGTVESPLIGIPGGAPNEILECPLHHPKLNELLSSIKTVITEAALMPYDVQARRGELKGIVLLSNQDASEVIVRFVLRSTEALPRIRKRVVGMRARFPQVKVVSVNLLPEHVALVEGREEIVLTEGRYITVRYNGINVRVGPQSFTQVTHSVAASLYAYVSSLVQEAGPVPQMMDLFCGVGGFSFASAAHVKAGVGVELSPDAVACAEEGTILNNTPHLSFMAADVEEFLESYGGRHPSVIVVNPPRRGLSKRIIESIKNMAPARVLYSSCNIETFLRDAEALRDRYQLHSVKLFDMFPFTEHLELVGAFHLT